MLRRIVRRLVSIVAPVCILTLAAVPLRAQAQAHFVLVITGGIPPYIRGELRLTRQPVGWQGTLGIEESDSLLPVTGIRNPGDSIAFDTSLLGGMHFAGLVRNDGLNGTAVAQDGVVRTWTATRLNPDQEFYPSLPRFTLRQIVLVGTRVPGPLPPALASMLSPIDKIAETYRSRAAAGGWSPLAGQSLGQNRGLRALGLIDRSRTIEAERATLSAIEAGITDPAVHRRFVALFRPAGSWIVDIHDAALRSAALAQPGMTLASIRPALKAIGETGLDTASTERLLGVVYHLVQLQASDSAAFGAMIQAAGPPGDGSRKALLALLDGYASALDWQAVAQHFLLTDAWLPDGLGARSVAELVGKLGIGATDSAPRVRPRLLGYVQAFPHIRISDPLVDSLVRGENPNARQWLSRHGRDELLEVLHHLPSAVDTGMTISDGGVDFRLSTIGRESALRESGFLEPSDEIVIEAGLSPLLSVQTLVHEWIHILHEHARERAGRGWQFAPGGSARYQPVTPILAEGFAEWEAERALQGVLGKFPLLGIIETEKRAAMAAESPDDPHLVGYRLLGGLATKAGEQPLRRALIRHAEDPDDLAAAPELQLGASRARPSARPELAARALLPEARFTIDDTYPQLLGVRIVTPFARQ